MIRTEFHRFEARSSASLERWSSEWEWEKLSELGINPGFIGKGMYERERYQPLDCSSCLDSWSSISQSVNTLPYVRVSTPGAFTSCARRQNLETRQKLSWTGYLMSWLNYDRPVHHAYRLGVSDRHRTATKEKGGRYVAKKTSVEWVAVGVVSHLLTNVGGAIK